jgi:hypothetical protein
MPSLQQRANPNRLSMGHNNAFNTLSKRSESPSLRKIRSMPDLVEPGTVVEKPAAMISSPEKCDDGRNERRKSKDCSANHVETMTDVSVKVGG